MPVPIQLESGETGELTGFDGKLLSLTAPTARAPGQPTAFTVQTADGAREYAGRSIGSKLRDDGRFDVRMRLVNLTRVAREALQALFA